MNIEVTLYSLVRLSSFSISQLFVLFMKALCLWFSNGSFTLGPLSFYRAVARLSPVDSWPAITMLSPTWPEHIPPLYTSSHYPCPRYCGYTFSQRPPRSPRFYLSASAYFFQLKFWVNTSELFPLITHHILLVQPCFGLLMSNGSVAKHTSSQRAGAMEVCHVKAQ